MKLKEETAKTFIMMIIVMTFVLPGFEHSIANMGTFSMTFTALGTGISWSGVWLHMLLSTLGNIIGGSILLVLPIYLMIRPKKLANKLDFFNSMVINEFNILRHFFNFLTT